MTPDRDQKIREVVLRLAEDLVVMHVPADGSMRQSVCGRLFGGRDEVDFAGHALDLGKRKWGSYLPRNLVWCLRCGL